MGFICQRLDPCVARMLQGRRAGSQQKHRGNTFTLDEDFRFRRDTLPADHPTETCEKIHLAARQKITHPITLEQRAPGLVLEKLANDPGLAVALGQNRVLHREIRFAPRALALPPITGEGVVLHLDRSNVLGGYAEVQPKLADRIKEPTTHNVDFVAENLQRLHERCGIFDHVLSVTGSKRTDGTPRRLQDLEALSIYCLQVGLPVHGRTGEIRDPLPRIRMAHQLVNALDPGQGRITIKDDMPIDRPARWGVLCCFLVFRSLRISHFGLGSQTLPECAQR